jgi:protein-S-isoprenylcysteine O-methyltransferase Ste14
MDSGYPAWAARWRVPLGFAFGIAYVVFCQPALWPLVSGGVVALLGLLLRAYAAGCLDKNRSLAMSGPYARTRNPLYLGSFVMGAGFAIAGNSWAVGLAFLGLFFLVYWPVMRREEKFLRQQFGETYERYASAVPFFLPTGRRGLVVGEPFRWERYRKNREYQAAFGCFVGIVFLALKMMLR